MCPTVFRYPVLFFLLIFLFVFQVGHVHLYIFKLADSFLTYTEFAGAPTEDILCYSMFYL